MCDSYVRLAAFGCGEGGGGGGEVAFHYLVQLVWSVTGKQRGDS